MDIFSILVVDLLQLIATGMKGGQDQERRTMGEEVRGNNPGKYMFLHVESMLFWRLKYQ